jgi:hypothetical protein
MSEDFPMVVELRKELKVAQRRFNEHPGYQTALELSKAKKAMAHAVDGERGAWMVIDGSGGVHSIPPLEVAVAALWEVKRVAERNLTVDYSADYVNKVVRQALITLGEIDESKTVQAS